MNRFAPIFKLSPPAARSFSYDHQTGEVVVRLKMGDGLPAGILDVLNALVELVSDVRRTADAADRQARTDERIEAMRARHVEVARTYQRLRLSGLKHRAAIRSIFIDPAFSDLSASTADIAFWVKAYGLCLSGNPKKAGAAPKGKRSAPSKS